MLVLTRKVGDVIAIGDNIKIVVMAIKGKQVRLGVQADRNTIVHREEIYQKIQQETRAALQNDAGSAKAAGDLLRGASEERDGSPAETRASSPVEKPKRSTPGFVVRKASHVDAVDGADERAPSKRGSND